MIRRVGEVLSFKAKSVPMLVASSPFADVMPIEEISGIELNPWFSGGDFHKTSSPWIIDTRGKNKSSSFSPEYKIVIIPASEVKLLVV